MTSESFEFKGRPYVIAPAVHLWQSPYPPRSELCVGCARRQMSTLTPLCDDLRIASTWVGGSGGCNFATFNGVVFVLDTPEGWEFYLRAKLSGDDNVED